MKREIKFRAWDNITKSFVLPSNLVFRLDGHLFDREFDEELHHVELMQFTGLLDKNGKEIYADDIISNGEYKYRVYAVPGGFSIKAPYWSDDMRELSFDDYLIMNPLGEPQNISWVKDHCEVIGNIYENPELLNQ